VHLPQVFLQLTSISALYFFVLHLAFVKVLQRLGLSSVQVPVLSGFATTSDTVPPLQSLQVSLQFLLMNGLYFLNAQRLAVYCLHFAGNLSLQVPPGAVATDDELESPHFPHVCLQFLPI